MQQLRVVREMLTSVGDERLGIVIDGIWSQEEQSPWGCLVSTWHEGLRPLSEVLVIRSSVSVELDVFGVMRSIARQLQLIHEGGYAHGDVSLPNVRASNESAVHIVDFEHVVGTQNMGRERSAGTPGYTHPAKAHAHAAHVSLEQHQAWDRYGLGQIFLSILATLSPHTVPQLTARNQRAVRMLGCLLLDGQNTETELALGLPPSFFTAHGFQSVRHLISAIDRVTGREKVEDQVSELSAGKSTVVEVGLRHPVAFSQRTASLLDSRQMRFLGQFNQLGLVSFIWPTATHSRLQHAIGTYGLAAEFVLGLLNDSENPTAAIILTPSAVRTVLLAALLHDVGHYPLAHDLEEAHPEAFKHEDRSVQLILDQEIADTIERPERLGGWGVSAADVASVIEGRPLTGAGLSEPLCGLLHSIISGPIDADKLDYLHRDSRYLNVAAGNGLDLDRILNSLTIITNGDGGGPLLGLGIRSKGRRSAELVGRIRSHMFGVVYWHHSYRSIKAMIQWMVWDGLSQDERPTRLREYVNDFYREIDGLLAAMSPPHTSDQPALFSVGGGLTIERGALPAAEAHVLSWLSTRGGPQSKVLFDHLGAHSWHRCVLTVAHYSNESTGNSVESESAWSLMDALYKLPIERYWRARKLLAESFQRSLCEWLDPQVEGNAGTIVFDFTDTKRLLLSASVTDQIFLVDGPDPSRAMQKPLLFSLGERRGVYSVDASEAIPAARSYDEQQLTEGFVATNGAIRVLCDPRFDQFVQTAVSEETLQAILTAALTETLRLA